MQFGGKGKSGKTTLAGTLARVLAARGQRVVAPDDDSNPNLTLTVGLSPRGHINPPPLPRDLLEEAREWKEENSWHAAIAGAARAKGGQS